MNFIALFKKNKKLKAFAFLFFAGLIIAAASILKTHLLNKSYIKPSPLQAIPTLFFYLGFSTIAFVFPWSWKLRDQKRLRLFTVFTTAVFFVVTYLSILSMLEWATSSKEYSLWSGMLFSIYYSGLLILLTYGLISYGLFFIGITKETTDLKKKEFLDKISFKSKGVTSFINVSEIVYFEANDNYISVYTSTNKHHLIRKTISKLETQLDPATFQRVHRKHLVNISKIKSIKADPKGGYFIEMPFNRVLKMSKTYKEKLKIILPSD